MFVVNPFPTPPAATVSPYLGAGALEDGLSCWRACLGLLLRPLAANASVAETRPPRGGGGDDDDTGAADSAEDEGPSWGLVVVVVSVEAAVADATCSSTAASTAATAAFTAPAATAEGTPATLSCCCAAAMEADADSKLLTAWCMPGLFALRKACTDSSWSRRLLSCAVSWPCLCLRRLRFLRRVGPIPTSALPLRLLEVLARRFLRVHAPLQLLRALHGAPTVVRDHGQWQGALLVHAERRGLARKAGGLQSTRHRRQLDQTQHGGGVFCVRGSGDGGSAQLSRGPRLRLLLLDPLPPVGDEAFCGLDFAPHAVQRRPRQQYPTTTTTFFTRGQQGVGENVAHPAKPFFRLLAPLGHVRPVHDPRSSTNAIQQQ
mmetsp:Transcript_18637/g.36867  ORF Transcript_18637/g.36867 Transcript_18637/m.36867 type:complete len:375 (+) Transcript_18637:344-1468(+)